MKRFAQQSDPLVSIIILFHATAALIDDALESLLVNVDPRFPYEVILVANGVRPDVLATVQRAARGARVIVSDVNLGFAGGCNLGASAATAPYLVFLNDDVEVEPDWLESLVRLADQRPDAGAIGSRIAFPDGTLQEAGSIIFADGTTMPIGAGLPASTPRWRAVREVDYCSACSLLVRREAFEEIRGFDIRYSPGYYEDVDLALKLRTAGWRVLYQPRSRLLHLLSQSYLSDFKAYLFRRNIETLRRRWASLLPAFVPPAPWDSRAVGAAVRAARRATAHVLVIDDRLPDASLGSGFGRMAELCRDVHGSHCSLSFYPVCGYEGADEVGDFGVEVIDGPLVAWLDDPATHLDAVVISRPHNWEAHAGEIRRRFPSAPLIYDAEALFHRRFAQLMNLTDDPVERATHLAQHEKIRSLERGIAREADHIVCVSGEEAAILREFAPAASIEHMAATASGIRPTSASFDQRAPRAVFVAGWMAGPTSPNVDALRWFAEDVVPQLVSLVPECEIIVTGANPPGEARRHAGTHVRLVGFVDDLAGLYAAARVAIAPIRFGAGVKIKAIEALQYGVPVVSTSTGADGIQLEHSKAIVIADDAGQFAVAVATLLTDRAAWEASRTAALRQARTWDEQPRRTWLDILDEVLERRLSAARASSGARATLLRDRDLAAAPRG